MGTLHEEFGSENCKLNLGYIKPPSTIIASGKTLRTP
jgi:hypothetical protein